MTNQDKEEAAGTFIKGFGLEGLLNGLEEFLTKVLELAEKGEMLEGIKTFEGRGYKGEYRYGISTLGKEAGRRGGIGIRPGTKYERPKYRPSSVKKTKIVEPKAEEKESLVDVFDINNHVLVVVSLPNIKEEDLEFDLKENVLKITAKTLEGRIEKDITIPEDSMVSQIEEVSFKHGILEIKLKKKRVSEAERKE